MGRVRIFSSPLLGANGGALNPVRMVFGFRRRVFGTFPCSLGGASTSGSSGSASCFRGCRMGFKRVGKDTGRQLSVLLACVSPFIPSFTTWIWRAASTVFRIRNRPLDGCGTVPSSSLSSLDWELVSIGAGRFSSESGDAAIHSSTKLEIELRKGLPKFKSRGSM